MSSKIKARATSPASFDHELAELEALSERFKQSFSLEPEQIEHLRTALAHRNNFIVSKAARLVGEAELAALLPELLVAYGRFFHEPVKADPKCWAKEALAKALLKLEHREKDTYIRGLRHIQMEPSFGPPADSAGTLRATCAHALVDCPGLSDAELLALLLEALTDTDKSVRIEAARAIANVGGISAPLILRLRAQLGLVPPDGDTPEVLGAVYSALLSLDGTASIPLVSKALEPGDDLAAEAAFALADMRTVEALAPLLARFNAGVDPWFSGVLLSAIALTRLPQACDFLLDLIARDTREAASAIEAITRSSPSEELRIRVEQAIEQADSPRLREVYQEHLGPSSH
jgi:HEAT repeat protein